MIHWLVSFVFFALAAFFQRSALAQTELGFFGRRVDTRFGEGTYSRFKAQLRPTRLFMAYMLTTGVVGLAATYISGADEVTRRGAYLIGGIFLSGGLGLLVAYLLSIRFPPNLR
jgi:hypothetical protein